MMSLFNRPAWAKTQTNSAGETDDSANIFSHSSRSYREIVAEQERKKKAKLERKKAKEVRNSSEKQQEVKHERSPRDAKRRRITLEDGEALLSSVGLSSKVVVEPADDWDAVVIEDEQPVRRSPRNQRHINVESPRKPVVPREIVDLGDDDHEGTEEVRYEEEDAVYETPPPKPVEVADDSDDDFAELQRKARQNRQQKQLDRTKSCTPDIAGSTPSPGIGTWDTMARGLPTPPPDPAVEILVTSPIPGTQPLIVHRKLSQRVQEIRTVWCTKQGFTAEMTKDVFFIHCMRKIYDATTCKSLGLSVDAYGNIVMKGAEGKEGAEKVHLLAVTEEIFQEMKATKARDEQRRSEGLPVGEGPGTDTREQEPAQEESKEATIRLVLKARGRKDFKLVVKPTTPFSKIISAYRKMHQLDESATIRLEVDGDRLDPDDEVQNTDITDLDCLDVHIN